MLRLGAHIISFVMHPLLMPTLLFATLMYFVPASIQPDKAHGTVLFLIFMMTFILPVINLLFFKMTGTLRSFYLPARRDRVLPFLLISLLYVAIAAMFYWKMYSLLIFKLMVIVAILSLWVTVANFFFKISVHAVGSSGLAGILLSMATLSSVSDLIWPAITMIVLAGLAMSSRLLLNAHNLSEVSWGGVSGFVVGFSTVGFLF